MRCDSCGAEYDIEDGIARLLYTDLTAEDKHEIAIRDAQNADALPRAFMPPPSGWRSEPSDLLEIPDHLAELDPGGRRILEIGCGDGRFTIIMARMEAHVLAVDFSIKALQVLASRLSSGIAPTAYQVDPQHKFIDLHGLVGLVHADASHFCVAPRSFDRALSTTPLDSRDERMTMYRTIAEALTDQGRFVGSVENDDLNRSLLGLPVARRYSSGIFIEHFDSSKVRREVAPYFSKLRIRPIRPRLPFCHRLASSWVLRLSRLVAVTPVIRHFGEILLFRAERPVRPPREGVHRPGSKPAKHLYRWYMLKIGKAPLWEGHEPV
jgi:SAM-dependent methyltransferase